MEQETIKYNEPVKIRITVVQWVLVVIFFGSLLLTVITMNNISITSDGLSKQVNKTDLLQKQILDKLTASSHALEKLQSRGNDSDQYLQSLVARVENKSIPDAVKKAYLIQLQKLTGAISPEILPLSADTYEQLTENYKEYVLTTPMFIQDSQIRELMRVKALMKLSDSFLALENLKIKPKNASDKLTVVMSQYGDLFDQNEHELISERLTLVEKSRLFKANSIIDILSQPASQKLTEETLHLAEERLLAYSDTKEVQNFLIGIYRKLWNEELDASEAKLNAIKENLTSNFKLDLDAVKNNTSKEKNWIAKVTEFRKAANDMLDDVNTSTKSLSELKGIFPTLNVGNMDMEDVRVIRGELDRLADRLVLIKNATKDIIELVESGISLAEAYKGHNTIQDILTRINTIPKDQKNLAELMQNILKNHTKATNDSMDRLALLVTEELPRYLKRGEESMRLKRGQEIAYFQSLIDILNDMKGSVWNENDLPEDINSRRFLLIQNNGQMVDGMASIIHNLQRLDAVEYDNKMDDNDKVAALRLVNADIISSWIDADSLFRDLLMKNKNSATALIQERQKKIDAASNRKFAIYISNAIGVIQSVDSCVDEHDDDKEKFALAKAMLNIDTQQLPAPVYGLFQLTYDKVNEEDNLLDLAKYSALISEQGKSLDESKKFILHLGCGV